MSSLPILTPKHDLALWLVNTLTNQQTLGESMVVGTLPAEFDFGEVDQALSGFNIEGVCEEATRRVEFYPSWANVYVSLDELLSKPGNLCKCPAVFTLRDIAYTYGGDSAPPEDVLKYLNACKLYQLLRSVADLEDDGQKRLVFLQRHDSKLAITLQYSKSQLLKLADLDEFASTFVDSNHHKDQKRTIIRTSLIEMFKNQPQVTLGDLLVKFDAFMESVRSAYAMYVAEFSFEKIKAEIEKDNLDSAVKLQKTITDIQNQLLALPLAVLLAGGQMTQESDLTIKNAVIWLGCMVFVIITLVLISNQLYTVRAIKEEVDLRQKKLSVLPHDIRIKSDAPFLNLRKHVSRQDYILRWMRGLVITSALLSTGLLVWYTCPSIRP